MQTPQNLDRFPMWLLYSYILYRIIITDTVMCVQQGIGGLSQVKPLQYLDTAVHHWFPFNLLDLSAGLRCVFCCHVDNYRANL